MYSYWKQIGERVLKELFDAFGVSPYHSRGITGQGVHMLVIDTGCAFSNLSANHGLAVSSIISAPQNSHGLVGIAPHATVKIIDVRDPGSIPVDVVIDAIATGIRDNVDIISISLGTSDAFEPLQDIIRDAHAKGILVFAATGNSGEMGYEFPAAYEHVISVASINVSRQPSPFNTRNDAVAVFAPGEDIKLPVGDALVGFTGTSFATPFAAGVAALVLCDARTRGVVRISRDDMVRTLRDADHLDLNCNDHTFATDGPKCFGAAPLPRRVYEKSKPSVSIVIIIIVLLATCIGFVMEIK